jgi:hypothetical protein
MAQRKSIGLPGPKTLPTFRKLPPTGYMAAGYILPPDVEVPMMGAHWVDPKSPELNGNPFQSTFIYGSYDGQVAFLEPMVALAFLESKPNFEQPISVPKKVAKSGYYPTRYKVSYNADRHEYSISLEGLVMRQGILGKVAKN